MKLIFVLLFAASTALSQVTPKHHYRLGYKHDSAGITDKNLAGTKYRSTPIHPHTDLLAQMHAVYDQGQQGSCVGHGCSEAWSAAYYRVTGKMLDMSRSFPYWNARNLEGTTSEDSGCQIRDCVSSLLSLGDCSEGVWRYNDLDYTSKPSASAYAQANGYLVLKAYKVDSHDGVSIRQALSAGFPVIFGTLIYPAFEDLNSSHYLVPYPTQGQVLGGHCMILYGSDDASQIYSVQNQWGTSWGSAGRCQFPYAYIHGSDTDDCWVIELVNSSASPPSPAPAHHWWPWQWFSSN